MYCDRWLIDNVTEDMCRRCKEDAVYRQKLVEHKIAELERRYQQKTKNNDNLKPCKGEGERAIERRKCCGGNSEREVEVIYCKIREKTVTVAQCRYCTRRQTE